MPGELVSLYVAKALPSTELEDGLVLLDAVSSNYCLLNDTAAAVWRLLELPRAEEDIVSCLQEQFDCSATEFRAEVRSLLRDFQDRGWVEVLTQQTPK